MPTYEYLCNRCQSEFEAVQRISDPPHAACPLCGAEDTKRLISHTSFVLKGTGWYATDYGRKGSGGASSPSSPAKPPPKDASEGKPDAPKTDVPAAPDSKPASS